VTLPTPPGGRGQHAASDTAGQSLSAWAAGLPRQQAPARPAPAESAPPAPAPSRRRAGVIDRLDAPDFPIADYARSSSAGDHAASASSDGDDDATGRMPGLGDSTPPPPPVTPTASGG
jgi:UPF0755 protein